MDAKSLIQGRAAEAQGESSETEQRDGWSNKGRREVTEAR